MPLHVDYNGIPYHMREGARQYLEHGIEPGQFLRKVFENDLVGALGQADTINVRRIYDWGDFLYNQCPLSAWGSKAKVKAWIARGGLLGKKV